MFRIRIVDFPAAVGLSLKLEIGRRKTRSSKLRHPLEVPLLSGRRQVGRNAGPASIQRASRGQLPAIDRYSEWACTRGRREQARGGSGTERGRRGTERTTVYVILRGPLYRDESDRGSRSTRTIHRRGECPRVLVWLLGSSWEARAAPRPSIRRRPL